MIIIRKCFFKNESLEMYNYPKKPKTDKNDHSPERPVLSRALLFCFLFFVFKWKYSALLFSF